MGILDKNEKLISYKDIKNSNAIFKTVAHLIEKFDQYSVIAIEFDNTLREINPIFFVVLLMESKKKSKKLFIDTRFLSNFVQREVQHFLRQQLDLEEIELLIKDKSHKFDLNILPKSSIAATVDATRSAIAFSPDKENGYHILPIMALRHYQYLVDRWDDEFLYERDDMDPMEKRKAYYSRVALHHENLKDLQAYQRVLKQTIEDFFRYLHINNKLENAKPLSTILFELIDNIRKHTPDEVSGHFSFSRIQKKDYGGSEYCEYQMIVADNGEEGMLWNYLQELQNERKKLSEIVQDEKIFEEYDNTIKLLQKNNNDSNKLVLNELYDLESIRTTHQVPRVAMHFGIPMLLKMLPFFKDVDSRNNLLEVYTHRAEQYYKVTYDSNAQFRGVVNVDHEIKGTYVILTFTDRIDAYQDLLSKTNFVGNIKNQDFEKILDQYENFQIQINRFQFIKDISSIPDETNQIILDASTAKSETFSEFLRQVYFEASKKNLTDIVIANTDIKSIYSHLQLMAHIIYDNIDKPYKRTINLLFYDKYSPGVIFLGGKSKEEFLYIADKLKHYYQIDTSLGLKLSDDTTQVEQDIEIESSLFFENYLLPFELFSIKDDSLNDIILLENMLGNFLNKTAIKNSIHVDTQVRVHIDKFIDFRSLFEDSTWIKRFAFRLTSVIDSKYRDSKIFFIGTDVYTNLLLSLVTMYLDSFDKNRVVAYKIYNIYNENGFNQIKEKIESLWKKENLKIVLVSSVKYKGEKLEILKETFENILNHISVIQLLSPKSDEECVCKKEVHCLFCLHNNDRGIYEFEEGGYCNFCKKDRDIPLLELDEEDPFLLKDTFFENNERFDNRHKSQTPNNIVVWKKSLYFGHIERGSNHFLYYIDTVEFFNHNKDKIESYLSEFRNRYKTIDNALILAPSHDTNNNFINLVNKIVFDNEATVLHFDKTKGEDNFYRLSSYDFDWKKTKVFFVDDSISSGYTLEYFYTLSKKMKSYSDNSENDGFDDVFIMIDRADFIDKNIIQNYLKTNAKINTFTSYHVKPIKTEVEACFLCTRVDEYLDLMTKSVLDLTIFQMANKALKIRKKSYKDIEKSIKDDDVGSRVKAYIKALATDFIVTDFDENKDIEIMIQEFSRKVFKLFKEENKAFVDSIGEAFAKQAIAFESKIALLKAMSFPKLSYRYEIRGKVIQYIVKQVNDLTIQSCKNKEDEEKRIEQFKSFITQKIVNNQPNEQKNKLKDYEYEFIDNYQKKTHMHLLNAYFSILGYFKDPILLREEYIALYYLATQKKDDFDDKKVLHTYPFAVKMTISDNEDKSTFFENNLKSFMKKQERGEYRFGQMEWALVDALYLENTLYDRNAFIEKIPSSTNQTKKPRVKDIFDDTVKNKNGLEQRFKEMEMLLNKYIEDASEIKLFIFPDSNNKFKDYEKFLLKAQDNLVDVFNNFENLDTFKSKDVIDKTKEILVGMYDDGGEIKGTNPSNINQKIDDTWVNYYIDGYTIVRLVQVDKNKLFSEEIDRKNYKQNINLWFKPIGCIVIKHDNEQDHLKIVRKVLAIRYELVEYLVDELGQGGLQEAIQNREYENIFSTFNHDIAPLFELNRILESCKNLNDSDIKQKIKNYVEYAESLIKIGRIKRYDDIKEIENPLAIKDFLDKDEGYGNLIDDFFYLYKTYIKPEENQEILQIEGIKNLNDFVIPLSDSHLLILFCELLFNAYKYSPSNKKTIEIKEEENILYIENFIDHSLIAKGNQIAISNLKYMLNKINWKLETTISEDKFVVKISKN